MPVVVIRPEPGCAATVASARAAGLDARAFPLFAVAPRAWQPPAADGIDALLLGSANAIRHAGPMLARYRGKPAYVVGDETARVAGAAGLAVVAIGEGGMTTLLARRDAGHRRLLRLAGEARVALDPPAGVTVIERVVYVSAPLAMPAPLAALLAAPALVLLHSAAAARHFAAESGRLGIARATVAIAALAPAILAAAGGGWRAAAAAANPRDPAMLALAGRMCQDTRRMSGGQDVNWT